MTAYLRPRTLAEVLEARSAHPDYWILAGGTDLMVDRVPEREPLGVIDIFGISEMVGVSESDGRVRIGAATTYAHLLGDEVVTKKIPALASCVREIGAVQIRNRGTIGGNICTSSPVGDTLPMWLALDADVILSSADGARVVPYGEFCTGYRRTAMGAREVVVAIELAPPDPEVVVYWRKVGTRSAQAISKVMLAARARVAGGTVRDSRVALGAVADRPVRFPQVEAQLDGGIPDDGLAEAAAALTQTVINPIDDVRSTARYRAHVAGRLVADFVRSLGAKKSPT